MFWNGTLLFDDIRLDLPVNHLQLAQGVLTALAALLLMLMVRRLMPLWRQMVLLGAFAAVSSLAICLAIFAGNECVSPGWMFVAFALSGAGSTLRLGWEERLCARGVRRTAACAGMAYLMGFVLFLLVSCLPSLGALVVSALLPFGAFGLLLVATHYDETSKAHSGWDRHLGGGAPWSARRMRTLEVLWPNASLKMLFVQVPWKLMAVIALTFFSYGATRTGGVLGGFQASDILSGWLAGLPALASFMGIALAYAFYRHKPQLAFYLAFPLMAMVSLVPSGLDSLLDTAAFCVALIGCELVKYLVWFLLIDSIIKDGLHVLPCLAYMRFAQWGGSCLGQFSHEVLPTAEASTIAVLLALMLALLFIMGSPLSFKLNTLAPVRVADDLAQRAALVAKRCKLTPREREVLDIWVTGHTGAYLEKVLFISKNTLKTHLNHIYAKTKTVNREELLELLESAEEG